MRSLYRLLRPSDGQTAMHGKAPRLLGPPETAGQESNQLSADLKSFLDAFVIAVRHRGLEFAAPELMEEYRFHRRVGPEFLAKLQERCSVRASFAQLSPRDLSRLGSAL